MKDQLSQTNVALLLFDLTMSYVQAILEEPRRHRIRQTFNDWNKSGQFLWKETIKELRHAGMEAAFDEHIAYLNEVLRQYLETTDPATLIALMKSFNQGEVTVTSDSDKSLATALNHKP